MSRKESGKDKKKKSIYFKILISCGIVAVLVILIFIGIWCFVPTLELVGTERVQVGLGKEYVEIGAKAQNRFDDVSDDIKIIGDVDTSKLGVYEVTYEIKKNGVKVTRKRIVEVIDDEAPTLTLKGELTTFICPGKEYVEEGYQALDNIDGDLQNSVSILKGEQKISYSVKDSSGNEAKIVRELVEKDDEKPVITLTGSTSMYMNVGGTYKEYGYKATDNCDGDLTSKVIVEGKVDTSKAGTYEIIYKVSDIKGNQVTVKRTVTVTKKVNVTDNGIVRKNTIYLTFDDGPSATVTAKILDILKEKNVKATFFVINHSSSLDYLIKREYEEGHTVALHSYTHDYATIYQSTDAYFKDLGLISAKVEKITGQKSMIIRFPGGSSNTVSRRYSNGIMTRLTSEVLNRGYRYYDWNVASGDAGGAKTKEQVYKNVTRGLQKNRANIVLMHDFENNYKTLNALSDIIDYGLKNGYEFAAIDMSTAMVRHGVNN